MSASIGRENRRRTEFASCAVDLRYSSAGLANAQNAVIDYYAWNLADWNVDKVTSELKRMGLEAERGTTGKSVLTKDLNGYPLMLCSPDAYKKPGS